MLGSERRPTKGQADRLFYLISIGLLALVAVKSGLSAVKDFSDGQYWQAAFGLVLVIVSVTVIEFLGRVFKRSRGGS